MTNSACVATKYVAMMVSVQRMKWLKL